MATLTLIPYVPQPNVVRKPSSKRVALPPSSAKKNVQFDLTDVPIEKLYALRVLGDSDLQQKATRDSEATAHSVQACRDNLTGTQGMCSDCIYCGVHLCLILYSSLNHREVWLR